MWFNSVDFAIFFVTGFFVYWFALKHSRNLQNVFLLIASYFFYGYWDWRFLSLIAFSSTIDYFVGLQIHKSDSKQLFLGGLCRSQNNILGGYPVGGGRCLTFCHKFVTLDLNNRHHMAIIDNS